MIRRAALCLLLLGPTAAHAALSGYYDSIEQITAILTSEAVAEQLDPWPIQSVEQTAAPMDGPSEWIVRSHECSLTVALTSVPVEDGTIGMATYRVEPLNRCD